MLVCSLPAVLGQRQVHRRAVAKYKRAMARLFSLAWPRLSDARIISGNSRVRSIEMSAMFAVSVPVGRARILRSQLTCPISVIAHDCRSYPTMKLPSR